MSTNETINPGPKLIAGFWIRVIADAIDMVILWAFAWALCLFMESWFLRLGESGAWVGLLVSIAYFVPMQSSFGKGQSFGKRLLGIQVLGLDGQVLSLRKSFLRYLVVAFVAYFGVFTGVVNLIVGSILAEYAKSIMVALWIVSFVGCYLLLPLHPLKRGLHDLIAGSVVVYRDHFNSAGLAALNNPAKAKKAFVILGTISLLTIVFGIWGIIAITKDVAVADLHQIMNKLESTGKLSSTSVRDNTFSNKSGTTRSIIVQAHVEGPLDQTGADLKASYDLAFTAIRDQIKDPSQYNNYRVGLRLGYNLGIRQRYTTLFQEENPSKPGERIDAGSSSNF